MTFMTMALREQPVSMTELLCCGRIGGIECLRKGEKDET